MKKIFILCTLVCAGIAVFTNYTRQVEASGTITGSVYIDYNMNGVRNTTGVAPDYAIDAGVAGVTVTAYDTNGTQGSTTSAADGTYSLAATGTGPYRIEFTNLPSGFNPSQVGTNNNSTVQYLPDGNSANIDLGIINNTVYFENNPLVVTPYQFNGRNTSTEITIAGVNFDNSGNILGISQINQLGATWGLAFQRSSERLFASSVLKRHSAFGAGADDIRGNQDDLGAIYVIDYSAGGAGVFEPARTIDIETVASVSLGANPRIGVSGNGPSGFPNGPDSDLIDTNHDINVFENAGRRGLGDIDVSEDGNTLYAVNINTAQPQLVALNISDLDNITVASVTNIPNPGCPATDSYAPWAIEVNGGDVYVGTVCTADTTDDAQNLRAYVQRLTGATFTNVDLDSTDPADYIQLFYDRSCSFYNINNMGCSAAEWKPWGQYPFRRSTDAQPLLSDIEFDSSNNLILGLMDRKGLQRGPDNLTPDNTSTDLERIINAGDILRVCNVSNAFVPEGEAGCAQSIMDAFDSPTEPLPGGAPGLPSEFFDDNSPRNMNIGHGESFFGGIAYLPGSTRMVYSGMNPEFGVNSGGLWWNNTADGTYLDGRNLYTASGPVGNFSKGGGVGDVELISAPAPLQIGNRVWLDRNFDGVQDPDELPIANAPLELWVDTDGDGVVDTLAGTTTTDANGNYVFGGISDSNMLPGFEIDPNTVYEVRIPSSAFTLGQPLFGLNVSPTNNDGSGNGDSRDSDSSVNPNGVGITLTTGNAGENNHTYDFGFFLSPTAADVSISGRILNEHGRAIRSAIVALNDESGNVRYARSNMFGYFRFDELEAGQTVLLTPFAKGYRFSSQLVSIDEDIAGLEFFAESDNGKSSGKSRLGSGNEKQSLKSSFETETRKSRFNAKKMF